MKQSAHFAVWLILIVSLPASAMNSAPTPEAYDLTWHTIDGGGGTSSAGGFEITGTIAQPDAGIQVMTGGGYEIMGGFWPLIPMASSDCPWDFDGDGDVDTADLLHLLGAWGTPDGDVDGDGDTDTADLLDLLGHWGECP